MMFSIVNVIMTSLKRNVTYLKWFVPIYKALRNLIDTPDLVNKTSEIITIKWETLKEDLDSRTGGKVINPT